MSKRTWFRVIGWGVAGGAAKRDPEEAWESALRGVPTWGIVSYCARHHLRLVEGTTRAAVEAANVSRAAGRDRRGKWWTGAAWR
jgi:hypothetical protein